MIKLKKIIKKQNGETFIEILAAMVLLAIIAGPLLSTVVAAVYSNNASKQKTEAASMAQVVMDEVKAKKGITETNNKYEKFVLPYTTNTKLEAYYKIESVEKGKVIQSDQSNEYTYSPSDAENPDLELVIDQGQSGDGEIASVELKAFKDGDVVSSTRLPSNINSSFNCVNDFLSLSFEYSGSNCTCVFSSPTENRTMDFIPANNQCIKLKVSFKNGHKPYSAEQLKIFTDSNQAIDLKAYITDCKESESGVCFINRSKEMEYEVNYMETEAFKYDGINELFKISVEIRKGSSVIYTASSYVKK